MTQYVKAGEESTPGAVVYRERLVENTEELETNSGRVVAMPGMHILESQSQAGEVFVVHPDDLTNANLWTAVS